ncbi:MAG: hypothetical protein AAFX06_19335 [Planctomycetota bacterium]
MDDAEFQIVVGHILRVDGAHSLQKPETPKNLGPFARKVLKVLVGDRKALGEMEKAWSAAVLNEIRSRRAQ